MTAAVRLLITRGNHTCASHGTGMRKRMSVLTKRAGPADGETKPDVIKEIPERKGPEKRGGSCFEVLSGQPGDSAQHHDGCRFAEALDSDQAFRQGSGAVRLRNRP